MELRQEIEPKFDILELHYAKILDLILKYTDFIDEYGDEDNTEYKNLELKLHNLTGKDMSRFNLWEYWEEEGAEVLAFRIGLPDPVKVEDITKDELTEIVKRLNTFQLQVNNPLTLKEVFIYQIDDYYRDFLKVNFPKYKQFQNKKGNYTIEETVEKLF